MSGRPEGKTALASEPQNSRARFTTEDDPHDVSDRFCRGPPSVTGSSSRGAGGGGCARA
jgi:hypothetical protein